MTLRIEQSSDRGHTTIRLIGRMQVDHVAEVQKQIEASGPTLTLDLEDVTLVDVQAVRFLVATAVLTLPLIASAQSLTEAQARAAIAPWYALFNQPVQGDMRTLQEHVLPADYESCWGYLPGECWGRDTSIKVVGGFAKSIPT